MTDRELRGRLLAHFYKLRYNNEGIVPVTEEILSGGEPISREAIAGVCRDLAGVGLIEWTPHPPGHVIGSARITGPGGDAVERGGSARLEIRFPEAAPVATVTVKEAERINLAEGLAVLVNYLPAADAKGQLRNAFIRKAFSQWPCFALSYDDAEIDWTTGSVKIPRKREAFVRRSQEQNSTPIFFKPLPPRSHPQVRPRKPLCLPQVPTWPPKEKFSR